jgi:hypothetical protein
VHTAGVVQVRRVAQKSSMQTLVLIADQPDPEPCFTGKIDTAYQTSTLTSKDVKDQSGKADSRPKHPVPYHLSVLVIASTQDRKVTQVEIVPSCR